MEGVEQIKKDIRRKNELRETGMKGIKKEEIKR
jgi:hypothetical protein